MLNALIALAKAWGVYVIAALAALLALWAVHHHGYSTGRAACEAARQAAAAAEIVRQTAAGASAMQRAETAAVAGQAKDKSNQGKIRHAVKIADTQPDAAAECIPAAVADGLRDLD